MRLTEFQCQANATDVRDPGIGLNRFNDRCSGGQATRCKHAAQNREISGMRYLIADIGASGEVQSITKTRRRRSAGLRMLWKTR